MDRNGVKKCFDGFEGWSLSARRAWIEMKCGAAHCQINGTSLSARRAWIEISGPLNAACIWVVALRKESVDRNKCSLGNPRKKPVALRKESVDRNFLT